MDFSRRATQSCSCSGMGAGATGISSPIRTEEAMNAPPERELRTGETSKARLTHRKCDATARSVALRGIWGDAVKLRITPVLLDYRRLLADGQRLRCRAACCQSETPAGASKARWTRTWRRSGRGSP